MASIKHRLLDQSEEVYELLYDCRGFSVESESHDHVVIHAPSKHQAKGMTQLLRDRGFSSSVFNGNRIRTEYRQFT